MYVIVGVKFMFVVVRDYVGNIVLFNILDMVIYECYICVFVMLVGGMIMVVEYLMIGVFIK